MAVTRDIKTITTIEIMRALEKKTRELIPFSENQVGGDQLKKKILILLCRRRQYSETKRYYQLWLNPSIINREDELISIPKNDGAPFKVTLASIAMHVSSQPDRQLKRRNGQGKSSLEHMENIVKNAVKHGVGNCGELTALLFLLIRECPLPNHLRIFCELLYIKGRGDHVLAVINREPNSDLKDLSTWGPNAIICDPWFRETVNVAEQLRLSPNKQANIILFLSLYQKEEWGVSLFTYANEHYPHSEHWYKKRPVMNYFLDQQPNLICSSAEIKKPYPIALFLVLQQHLDMLKLLIHKGVELKEIGYLNVPLIFYALGGPTSIIKTLLENKVDPNVQLSTGLHPLTWAASRRDQKELKELLLKYAKTNDNAASAETDDKENRENLLTI